MTISFNEIPNNVRVPGVYIEVSNTQAQSALDQLSRIMVFGQRLPAGTQPAEVPVLVTSAEQAAIYFGRGSYLANMFATLFANNEFTEKWCIPLDDAIAGVQAAGSATITGTATANGTINLYIAGVRIQASVAIGDVQNDIAAALDAAINANLDIPVTSSVVANVITITARHKGLLGNGIDLRLNYLGDLGGETTPAGVAIVLAQLTGGTANPDLTDAIAVLPDELYSFWLNPYTDAANLTVLDTELDRRWGSTVMLEGHALASAQGTVSSLISLGNSRNNQHQTILDGSGNSPSPSYLWASAMVGQVAQSASIDPARPFTTLPLVSILAQPVEDRRTFTERNTLLYDGIATHTVTQGGQVQLERVITTYQKNGADIPDASYLDANTLFILSFLRQSLRARITQRFPRHKLADDGTRFGAGQAIVTPNVIKAEIIALAGQWEEAALVEDMDGFKENLIVERDPVDRTRLNAVIPPDLVTGFYVFAAVLEFRL